MKTICSALLILLLAFTLNAQHKKLNVLFLGNSYTDVNNLPQLIKDVALANGDTLLFDSNCPGGQTFYGHSINSTSISKINAQPWDHVVLQAQSQEPSFSPSQVNSQTLPYAIKLDSMIKHNNACTETVFYETWGRKNGDAGNCGSYPPVCTYVGMQNRLRASYKQFADISNATFSPAGEAFRKSITLNPGLELYSPDESHPSLEGSYLVACVFYEVLFHKSILTNTYTAGVSLTNAAFLKQIAHDVVNDSLNTWNIGKYTAYAPFTSYFISALNCGFTSASPTLNNKWYFGDGTTTVSPNPTHLYATAQTYTVSHIVTDGCKKDSTTMVLNVVTTGLNEQQESMLSISNPVNDELILFGISTIPFKIEYVITTITGEVVVSGKAEDRINIRSLANGIYFLTIIKGQKHEVKKFIKQ